MSALSRRKPPRRQEQDLPDVSRPAGLVQISESELQRLRVIERCYYELGPQVEQVTAENQRLLQQDPDGLHGKVLFLSQEVDRLQRDKVKAVETEHQLRAARGAVLELERKVTDAEKQIFRLETESLSRQRAGAAAGAGVERTGGGGTMRSGAWEDRSGDSSRLPPGGGALFTLQGRYDLLEQRCAELSDECENLRRGNQGANSGVSANTKAATMKDIENNVSPTSRSLLEFDRIQLHKLDALLAQNREIQRESRLFQEYCDRRYLYWVTTVSNLSLATGMLHVDFPEGAGQLRFVGLTGTSFDVYDNVDDFRKEAYLLERVTVRADVARHGFVLEGAANETERSSRTSSGVQQGAAQLMHLDCAKGQKEPDLVFEKWLLLFDLVGVLKST
mmetsp:Transcript_6885/g.16764  ORF Transcript_6885/g.16764 Transcript_6885/m.16764 type:complete len:391 (+) Transcript_6885:117-1289(+)